MKSKLVKLLYGLAAVALVGVLGVGLYYFDGNVQGWVDGNLLPSSSTSSATSQVGNGDLAAIRIQRLTTGVDTGGRPTQTLSYVVVPDNADDVIVASLAWANVDVTHTVSNVTDFLAAVVNPGTKTVLVTCLQAFDVQIRLTLKSAADASVYGGVAVDYGRKVLNITLGGSFEVPCDAADTGRVIVSCSVASDKVSYIRNVGGQFDDLSKIVYETSVYTVDALGTPTVVCDSSEAFRLGYGNVIGPVGTRSYDGTFTQAANSAWGVGGPSWSSVSAVVASANTAINDMDSADRSVFKASTYDGSNRKYVVLRSVYKYTVTWGGMTRFINVPVCFTIHPDQLSFNVPASSITLETGTILF
jgi:hypothetical protein